MKNKSTTIYTRFDIDDTYKDSHVKTVTPNKNKTDDNKSHEDGTKRKVISPIAREQKKHKTDQESIDHNKENTRDEDGDTNDVDNKKTEELEVINKEANNPVSDCQVKKCIPDAFQ